MGKRSLRAFTLGCAFSVGVALALPAGDVTPSDVDRDGVVDAVDQCPGTPLGDLIGTNGCSVCPCELSWSSHDAYVACVTEEVKSRRRAETMRPKEARAALVHAKISTCGDPTVTRCCVYRWAELGSPVTCTLRPPAECKYAVIGKWAEDVGPGSCTPNPCAP